MFTPADTRRAHEVARTLRFMHPDYRSAYAAACARVAEVKRLLTARAAKHAAAIRARDARTRAFAAYAGGMTIEAVPAPAPVIPEPAPVFRWREAVAAVAITFAVFASPLAAFAAPLL